MSSVVDASGLMSVASSDQLSVGAALPSPQLHYVMVAEGATSDLQVDGGAAALWRDANVPFGQLKSQLMAPLPPPATQGGGGVVGAVSVGSVVTAMLAPDLKVSANQRGPASRSGE